MSKKIKRAISVLLFIVLTLLSSTARVFAESRSSHDAARLSGDVNKNGVIDIMDPTSIQRYIAGFSVTDFDLPAADVNGSRRIDIMDATLIQRYLADLSADGYIGCDLAELYMPSGLRCVAVDSGRALLQWKDPTLRPDGYEIYVRSSADGGEDRYLATALSPTYEALDLSPNTVYVFTVRAYRTIDDIICRAQGGAELSVTTMASPVHDLTLTLTVDRVYMTWTASQGADGYEIYCDTGSGPALFGSTTLTNYRSSDITGNTKYRFSVRTYKYVNGEKVVSAEATNAEGRSSPSMPGFTITRANGLFTVNWSRTKGADKYEVMMQTRDEEEMSVVALTDALTYSIPAPDIPEALFAVRSVKYADGLEYRGEYRIKSCSEYAATGTIGSFGDSIAFSLGSHQFGYAEMIGYDHRLRVDNRGVNSATLSITEGKHCICEVVLTYVKNDSTYDYILVEGGINDYYSHSPLGAVTPDGTTEFDRTTVCGGLETMFSHIRSTAPSAKAVYVLVHDINNTCTDKNKQGLTFLDYTAGIRDVCAKYGVVIADCSTELKTGDAEMCRQYTFTRRGIFPDSDGIHPTEEGYRRFYVPVIEEALFGD